MAEERLLSEMFLITSRYIHGSMQKKYSEMLTILSYRWWDHRIYRLFSFSKLVNFSTINVHYLCINNKWIHTHIQTTSHQELANTPDRKFPCDTFLD